MKTLEETKSEWNNQKKTAISLIVCATILLASLVSLTDVASAQPTLPTYFVSPSGNDTTGNGSAGNPFLTISHAVQISPTTGSIILAEPGMYHETVNITKPIILQSLTSNPTTTVLSALGETNGIVIYGMQASGSEVDGFTVTQADNHGIFVENAAYVTIENNIVTANGINANSNISEDKAIELVGTSFATVVANRVVSNMHGGIGLSDDGPINPGAVGSGPASPSYGNIVTDNILIGNLGQCGIVVSAYDVGEGVISNMVDNNVLSGNLVGIVVAADLPGTIAVNNTVSYNTVVDTIAEGGIILHSNTPRDVVTGNSIIGNTLSSNAVEAPVYTNASVGILLVGAVENVTNTVISLNVIHSEYYGIYVINGTGIRLTNNTFDSTVTVPVVGATISPNIITILLLELGNIQSEVSYLQSQLNATNSSSTGKFSNLSGQIATIKGEIQYLTSQLSSLGSSSSANSGAISSVNATIAKINSQVSGLASQIASLKTASQQYSYSLVLSIIAVLIALILGFTAIVMARRRK